MNAPLDTPELALRHLAEAVEGLDAVLALIELEPQRWFVEFEDTEGFEVTWSSERGGLFLVGDLGEPPAEREREVLRAALHCNSVSHPEASPRLACAADGPLSLTRELRGATADELGPALMHFEAQRLAWSLFVQAAADPKAQADTPFSTMGLRA